MYESQFSLKYIKLMEYRNLSPGTQVNYSLLEDVSTLLWIATSPYMLIIHFSGLGYQRLL
jgi:hypothetical protein